VCARRHRDHNKNRFLKNFYFNLASGQSILLNKVSNSAEGDIDATTLSLGDYAGSLGYRCPMKNRLSLGVETKLGKYTSMVSRYQLENGIGGAALQRAASYARERVVFGRPIGQNQGIAHPLAQCWM